MKFAFPIPWRLFLWLGMFGLGHSALQAQLLHRSLPFFTGHNTQSGFPAHEVNGFATDSMGMVWMATNLGLFRYDGIHFVNFSHLLANQPYTQSNYIATVFSDRKRNIWVSYENALACIAAPGQAVRNYIHDRNNALSAPAGTAFRITEDAQGGIWMCNGSPVLSRLNPQTGKFTPFRVPNPNPETRRDITIRDFYRVSDTLIWLASRAEMIRFNPQTGQAKAIHVLPGKGKISPGLITRICPDPVSSHILWLGTWGKGLLKFDTRTGETRQFLYQFGMAENISNIVFDLIPRNDHVLWAGGHGLVEFDTRTETFRIYTHDPNRKSSIGVNEVRSLYQSPDGQFWLGTVDGFSLYAPEQRQITLHALPFTAPTGNFIYAPETESVYYVNYFANRKLYCFNRNLEQSGSWVLPGADAQYSEPFGLCSDRAGTIWIATTRSGLWQFNPRTARLTEITQVRDSVPLHALHATTLRCDAQGVLWIGTMSNGLLRCDSRNPVVERVPEVQCRVDGLTLASDGSLWIQEDRYKLHQYDPQTKQLRSFGAGNSAYEARIRSLSDVCAGSDGRIYVSTLKNGILTIKGNQISPVPGLENLQHIHSIHCDRQGNLWMLSPNRLIRYDAESHQRQNYSVDNGLSGNLSYAHIIPVSDSEFWLQTSEGIFAIQTGFKQPLKQGYRLILNSIKVFDTEIAGPGNLTATQGIRLQHRQNYVSFDFQAIAFHQQEDLQYAYMLEGIDPDWIESGNRHFANYQALPPGQYRFKVKVSDGQNGWEAHEISIPVHIVPAWWQTWAFRIAVSVAILLGIAWLIRYFATRKLRKRLERLEQLQEIEQIRNRIARDIHDEIGSGLSKIALLSGTLERKSQGDDELLKASSRVRALSREVIRSMGEIIWAVNPGNDAVASLLSFVRSYLNQFSEESGISVHMELSTSNAELNKALLRPELKRNLLMVLKESLNNILKHAQATEIKVHLEFQSDRIRLLVHDNGKGLQGSPDFRHGNGMKNMHKRAAELKGQLDIESAEGLRILLDFPWNPNHA